ncbi:MAG: hypothetical protein H3C27_15685 [Opitutaceae bacterium]|nr:hypothetical protein [Opitutaceae bacterium]
MSIITLIRRRIRLARLRDLRLQQAAIRRAYIEQMSGIGWNIRRLEREHVRDITTTGPSSREIVRGIERQAKAGLMVE